MIEKSEPDVLRRLSAFRSYLGSAVMFLGVLVGNPAAAASAGETKSAGGLTVYLGVVPAEIIKGPGPHAAERPMHGSRPRGTHQHHIAVAVYDSATNQRITDATVTAKVSGLGLSGPQTTLEPMKIADTITYGAYFTLTADLYTIKVTVQRPNSQPVVLDFKYDHRRP